MSYSHIMYVISRIWYSIIATFHLRWLMGYAKTVYVAETNLPTDKGYYRVRSYRTLGSNYEPTAIIFGKVENQKNVSLRVHDQCFTSEVLGSRKCDCKDQLDYSMNYIRDHSAGIVIYLQQEGRGIGLSNKIAAYSLQELGYDTVDANRMLGLPDDARDYEAVVDILEDLNIQSINLMTNNPRKIKLLQQLGITINERIPIQIKANTINFGYLKTKATKMDHLLDDFRGSNPVLRSNTEHG